MSEGEKRQDPVGAEVGPDVAGSRAVGWQPNPEFLKSLMEMGIDKVLAEKALLETNNDSIDMAVEWVFSHNESSEQVDSEEDDVIVVSSGQCKMVFVVNATLDMGIGKIAAQVAHAALGLYRQLLEEQDAYGEMVLYWEQSGESKVVVKATGGETQIKELQQKAKSLRLPFYVVCDAGRTEVKPGSVTVIAIIGKVTDVNQVTGSLPLL